MQCPLRVRCNEFAGMPMEVPLDGLPVDVDTRIDSNYNIQLPIYLHN
jgi:hypothetical protein